MTKEMERIGKILVEAEGGEWKVTRSYRGKKCKTSPNPDFSEWANFGRLLKIAKRKGPRTYNSVTKIIEGAYFLGAEVDQIPALVATELVRVIEEGK